MENLIQQDPQQSITAAYDSVTLIENLNKLQVLSDEQKDSITRNKQHIEIMLTKEWFYDALTEEQKVKLFNICKNN